MNLPSPDFTASILDLACQIQQIPAPTFHEEQRARFMLDQFQKLGLSDTHIDGAGNVLARLPGKDSDQPGAPRPLVVSAHLDTVHPLGTPLNLNRQPDRIIGRSIGDNSLGLAALVALPIWLQKNQVRLPGDLWLAANVCEEGLGDLHGIEAVVDRFGAQPLGYLILEGMGLGNILHRGLGVERYKITVETPGGHSWSDFGQPSAIHILCKLVTQLTALALPRDPCTTLNVGVIQGGNSVNSIASHAWLELDLRSEDRNQLQRLTTEVHHLVHMTRHSPVQCTITRIGKRQPGALPVNHPFLRLTQAVLEELDLTPRLEIASTDANLPLSRGYPAICIGITYGANAHSGEEYILTEPVTLGLAQLTAIVSRAWQSLPA